MSWIISNGDGYRRKEIRGRGRRGFSKDGEKEKGRSNFGKRLFANLLCTIKRTIFDIHKKNKGNLDVFCTLKIKNFPIT